MKVTYDDDGNFAFIFDKSEKELGIDILLTIEPTNKEGYRHIDEAIMALKYAGKKIPKNVTRIY